MVAVAREVANVRNMPVRDVFDPQKLPFQVYLMEVHQIPEKKRPEIITVKQAERIRHVAAQEERWCTPEMQKYAEKAHMDDLTRYAGIANRDGKIKVSDWEEMGRKGLLLTNGLGKKSVDYICSFLSFFNVSIE